MADSIISARSVAKHYGSGSSTVTALADVSFEIPAGQRVAILGKSGSGKSTLMNLIGGLDTPTAGSLHVSGKNLGTLTRRELADYRLASIGFVFQSFHLIASRTAAENIELPLMLAKRPRAERQKAAREVLESVGLGERMAHYPPQLSGGERQRVAVARALVNQPAVLLADEPTGNLDSASAAAVMDMIFAQVRNRGMTLVVVTHDEELARRYAERILRMADGRIHESE